MKTNLLPLGRPAVACLLLGLAGLSGGVRPAAAQSYAGLAFSSYGGTNAAYVNPSAIADSRHRFYLNLVGGDANFYSTYLQLSSAQRPWQAGFSLERKNMTEQGGSGPHFASASLEVRLPALLLSLGPRSAVVLSSRVRGFMQASNVSDNLAKVAFYGLDQAQRLGLANHLLEDNSFNISVNAYHEFAFTYARVVGHSPQHFWKVGLTGKYLVGLGGGYVLNDGTKYQVYGRDSIQLKTQQLSYGATDYKLYGEPNFRVGSLYGSQQLGHGYGADVGVTYEWRPDREQHRYYLDGQNQPDAGRNKYRLRLGLAFTDLGSIAYDNAQRVRQGQLASAKTVQLGHLDTLRFRTLQQGENTLQRLTGLSSSGRAFTSYLPAALRLTADYHLAGPLYTGVLWVQNLLPARTIGSRAVNTLALVPRLELRHLELAFPLQLTNGYRQAEAGAMLRLGPLVLGSDNLSGLLGLTTATGADVYFGLAIAMQRHRPKDRDQDGVSNRYDKCPKEKGPWETRGCPLPLPAAPVPAPAETQPTPIAAPEVPADTPKVPAALETPAPAPAAPGTQEPGR